MSGSRTGVGHRPVRALVVVAALVTSSVAILISPVLSSVADSTTFTVINANDMGPGSLRQAVSDAAGLAGDDEVVVTPGLGPINLASQIQYAGASGAVTILGNGATITAGAFLAFNNQSGLAMTVDGFTITRTAGSNALNTGSGPLTVKNSTVVGGGVNTGSGDLTVSDTSVSGGSSHGVNAGQRAPGDHHALHDQRQRRQRVQRQPRLIAHRYELDHHRQRPGRHPVERPGHPHLLHRRREHLPWSPLLDKVPAADCQADGAAGITTDQRGVPRPQWPGCDKGAVEVQVAVPAAPVTAAPLFTG